MAGISLAYFLDKKSIILEKNNQLGGLCRSFNFNGITYDVGPHIIFSKSKEILDLHTSLVDTNIIKGVIAFSIKVDLSNIPLKMI